MVRLGTTQRFRLAASSLSAALLLLGAVPPAGAAHPAGTATPPVRLTFAPVDQPGPALTVPADVLAQALVCTVNAFAGDAPVVLFVPGTALTPKENFGWNWLRAFERTRRPYCTVTLPDHAMGDTQVSAEYVAHAIRYAYRSSGRKVQVVGYSQGGTEPRFALRFWPDLRSMVDDYVGIAATNHGAASVLGLCAPSCAPAVWQQNLDSNYVRAMNSYQETFPGISYTQIYTRTDNFVQPNLDDAGTTSLRGGGGRIANLATQDVCPANVAEHLAIGTYDPVAYALADDALRHGGPADLTRIDRSVCTELFQPGIDPATFPGAYADVLNTVATRLTFAPKVPDEPPLKPYTLAP